MGAPEPSVVFLLEDSVEASINICKQVQVETYGGQGPQAGWLPVKERQRALALTSAMLVKVAKLEAKLGRVRGNLSQNKQVTCSCLL